MEAFKAFTIHLSKATEAKYGGYQTARASTIAADHPPLHTPMICPPLNART